MTTETVLRPQVQQDVMAALSLANLPDVYWMTGDDLCDCVFQRIGDWTNPYLGQTLRVRMCCIWADIYKQFPQHVQEIPAFYDENRGVWLTEPQPWNSEESAMPVSYWFRQMAAQTGRSLSEIRNEYRDRLHERPGPVAKGTGRESSPRPTEAELAKALEMRLRAATVLLPEA